MSELFVPPYATISAGPGDHTPRLRVVSAHWEACSLLVGIAVGTQGQTPAERMELQPLLTLQQFDMAPVLPAFLLTGAGGRVQSGAPEAIEDSWGETKQAEVA